MGLRRVDLRGLRDRLHPPTGLAKNNATKAFGTPGTLDLTGRNLYGNYDACPAYNIQNFMSNGATLGKVTSFENDLHVVSCYQDLRAQYALHLTQLLFTVWNSKEASFEGSYECADSVITLNLLGSANSSLVDPANFDFATLGTPNARFQLTGVANPVQCPTSSPFPPTENVALLGVVSADVGLANTVSRTNQTGSNTQGAGIFTKVTSPETLPGAVWWDPLASSAAPAP